MSLAWKNAQRSDASMFLVLASFCAPLPSVSENARNSARIAITSAILRLKPSPTSIFSPSLAFSIASLISDMMAPVLLSGPDGLAQGVPHGNRSRVSNPLYSLRREHGFGSRARMRRAVSFDESVGVHFRVDLRGRQRRVAEQFLDRAQIAAAREEMRGEGMAQRMRRRRFGKPERAAQPRHRQLHEARRQRAAFGADKQRALLGKFIRT